MELTALALWLNTFFADFDEACAVAVHSLYDAAAWFFTPFLELISVLGKGGIFLIVLSLILMLFRRTRRAGCVMLLGLAFGAIITNVCVKPLAARPRPYTWEGSIYEQYWKLLGMHTESDKSFPSGHTTAAMDSVFGLCLLYRKKPVVWLTLLFPVLMGISRIYLSVHYCTDVLGGFLVGIIGGILAYWIYHYIPEKFYSVDLRKKKNNTQAAA